MRELLRMIGFGLFVGSLYYSALVGYTALQTSMDAYVSNSYGQLGKVEASLENDSKQVLGQYKRLNNN